MHRHYDCLVKAEHEPDYAPYTYTVWKSEDAPAKALERAGNVNEMLQNNQYDIITMQQGSAESWKPEEYEPYASELIKYIRKYQKHAEIVIQETWAYRSDAETRFSEFGISQMEMYTRLKMAYRQFAERYGFRVIPTGDAVQLFRERTPVKFMRETREFKYPELPTENGDVVGHAAWNDNKENTNEKILGVDACHLNEAGCFMQAALWFAFLYGEPTSKAASSAPELKYNSDVNLLLQCAEDALKSWK